MSDIERMTVVFPGPMAAQIRAAVAAGEYASTSEVVREAMRLWQGKQRYREHEIETMRKAWDAGKASGIYGPLDMDEIIAEAKTEKRNAEKASD